MNYPEANGDLTNDNRISFFSAYAYPQITEWSLPNCINIFNCEETGVCSWIPFRSSSNVSNPVEIYYDSTSGTFLRNNLRAEFKL